jgi:outer membrane protein assembly factor BamB
MKGSSSDEKFRIGNEGGARPPVGVGRDLADFRGGDHRRGGGSNPTGGDLIAIAGDGSHELWRFPTQFSPDMAGVAVANGVVYFTSTFSQQLFALDASSGALLKAIQVGNSDSGPSVVAGQIYVGTGDALSAAFLGISGPGTITALGL